MVLTVEWLSDARDDLDAEIEYVYNEFGSKSAENVYQKIVDCIDSLKHFPHLGKHFCGITYHGQELRSLCLKKTSIIYCISQDRLLVIALWNNLRDNSDLASTVEKRQ